MKIALVGATGMVGTEMLKVLDDSSLKIDEIIPVTSHKSVGKEIRFQGKSFKAMDLDSAIERDADIAIFSAGGDISRVWAPKFAAKGITVIDNSSAWRMDPTKKLVVPEINASELTGKDKIIANPNCSTIQMVLALKPLHDNFGIKRLVISTYQSVSGTGIKAVEQMQAEESGSSSVERVYHHPIHRNCIPHCDSFEENGYTKEEMKLVNETRKILGDSAINITATAVRVPVDGGHSESINVELRNEFDLIEVRRLIAQMPGVVIQDEPDENVYPMPYYAKGRDEVFVGRLRRDESQSNTLNMWVVSDNLRKGAATNAVQIAEYLVNKGVLTH